MNLSSLLLQQSLILLLRLGQISHCLTLSHLRSLFICECALLQIIDFRHQLLELTCRIGRFIEKPLLLESRKVELLVLNSNVNLGRGARREGLLKGIGLSLFIALIHPKLLRRLLTHPTSSRGCPKLRRGGRVTDRNWRARGLISSL